jgi:hypothetical protein
LLPGERGPAAQFMYQDAKGQRLTLYVRVSNDVHAPTAFRFAQENGVGVFYWLDGRLGYALPVKRIAANCCEWRTRCISNSIPDCTGPGARRPRSAGFM